MDDSKDASVVVPLSFDGEDSNAILMGRADSSCSLVVVVVATAVVSVVGNDSNDEAWSCSPWSNAVSCGPARSSYE